MTTFTVTTANDFVGGDGFRSLREAVNSANATPEADTIVFAPALEGQTLTLTQGELQLTRDVTIDGDADNNGSRVTLSGGGPEFGRVQPDPEHRRQCHRRGPERHHAHPRLFARRLRRCRAAQRRLADAYT